MIDKDIDSGLGITTSESSNGGDKQNHVSQTRKANQENLLELDLGDVQGPGHFTALFGKSEEKDDI